MNDKQTEKTPGGVKKRAQRVGRLHTVGNIVSEMGKLYRQARRGEINSADASRLASILALMRQGLEASELEQRLAALESGTTGAHVDSATRVAPKLLTHTRSAA